MDDKYLDLKKEIEKINQRIKEYLWKKWNSFKIKKYQPKSFRTRFLAGQVKFKKNY